MFSGCSVAFENFGQFWAFQRLSVGLGMGLGLHLVSLQVGLWPPKTSRIWQTSCFPKTFSGLLDLFVWTFGDNASILAPIGDRDVYDTSLACLDVGLKKLEKGCFQVATGHLQILANLGFSRNF